MPHARGTNTGRYLRPFVGALASLSRGVRPIVLTTAHRAMIHTPIVSISDTVIDRAYVGLVNQPKPRHWIGVDLDRTLAHRPVPSHGVSTIGEPIPPMLERVRQWLERGYDVRIFTARVASAYDDAEIQRALVRDWCVTHLGRALPVTAEKDGYMDELWDDLAVAVERNTGRQLSPSEFCGAVRLPRQLEIATLAGFLPRCAHHRVLMDWGGDQLLPPCGCRIVEPDEGYEP